MVLFERHDEFKAMCPDCGGVVFRFAGPVVSAYYGGRKGVRTHQVGADYMCANPACGSPLRVLGDGPHRLRAKSEQPPTPTAPTDAARKLPERKVANIPIKLPPREVV